jgi:hypothetical protein
MTRPPDGSCSCGSSPGSAGSSRPRRPGSPGRMAGVVSLSKDTGSSRSGAPAFVFGRTQAEPRAPSPEHREPPAGRVACRGLVRAFRPRPCASWPSRTRQPGTGRRSAAVAGQRPRRRGPRAGRPGGSRSPTRRPAVLAGRALLIGPERVGVGAVPVAAMSSTSATDHAVAVHADPVRHVRLRPARDHVELLPRPLRPCPAPSRRICYRCRRHRPSPSMCVGWCWPASACYAGAGRSVG